MFAVRDSLSAFSMRLAHGAVMQRMPSSLTRANTPSVDALLSATHASVITKRGFEPSSRTGRGRARSSCR